MRLHKRAALPGNEQAVIAAQPPMDGAMAMVIECWRKLHGSRALGFGCMGPIPFDAVLGWAKWRRLDRELTEMLLVAIEKLDSDRVEREESKRALAQGGK